MCLNFNFIFYFKFRKIQDVNDEIPIFIEKVQETVLEGMPKGTKVTQVEAVDHDGTYPNSKVSKI